MPLLPWWELKPERLEWEYAWLTQEGYKYEEISRDELDGTLEVQVEFPIDGKVLNLQVTFPPFFPDSRYQVRCADLKLPHHQNPFSNELCLLGRSTALWDPTVALAQFLKEQMPLLLKAGTTDDRSKADGIEDHQAEPVGAFLPFMGESGLLIDENFELGTKSEGEFNADVKITFAKDQLSVKGIITSLDGKQFWTPESDVVLHQLGFCKRISGRWYNISSFPPGLNAAEFVLLAQKDNPDLAKTKFDFELNHHLCELLAFHVPSETGHREIGREWLMVIRLTPRFGPRKARLPCCGYVRLKPFGRKLLYRRAPELHPLATKRIAVIGLGCIGAPAAIELARAAVGELRILDPDIIDAGTVVRWPIGLPAIGTLKITSIANFISQNFPFTKVVIESRRVGGITTNGGNGIGLYKIEEFLKDVDLVLDASAELGVSSLLSHIVSDLKIPLVSIASTNGGWGGTVVTYEPGKSGCYDCFLRHAADGVITLPPASQAEKVQPVGCAEPTYLASNFDIGEISLTGVRTAVSLLCNGAEGGYPALPRGIAVLSLRDPAGRPTYPTWQTYDLPIHPECKVH